MQILYIAQVVAGYKFNGYKFPCVAMNHDFTQSRTVQKETVAIKYSQ